MENVDIDRGIVVTDDYFGEEEKNGKIISFVPLWCWLLRG
jgi:predicted AAA+ superfamily ATPase